MNLIRHALAGGAALLCTLPCAAQQADVQHQRAISDLKQYHALIESYRDGKADVLQKLVSLPHTRLAAAVALIESPDDLVRPWEKSRFTLAAMMHSDAALQLVKNPVPEDVFFHLDIASRLLRRGGSQVAGFASRWYVAMSRWLRDRGAVGVADRLLKLGRDRLPHDPGVLYESGTLAEMLATDYSPRGGVDANITLREERLNSAAGWLRESLREDGSSTMTQLHLGRVLTLRHQEHEGLRHLQAALSATADPALAYLAALFTGAAYERQGRLDGAAEAYRLATAKFPMGHAASVALSQVLQKSGRGDESRAVLQAALALSSRLGTNREPWWWYLVEPSGVADARIVELREGARR